MPCACRCGCDRQWRPFGTSDTSTRCHSCRRGKTPFCKRSRISRVAPESVRPVVNPVPEDYPAPVIEAMLARLRAVRRYQQARERSAS
jgi:hypothetical protein